MKTIILSFVLIFSVTLIHAQNRQKKNKKKQKAYYKEQQKIRINEIVRSKDFIFKAQTVYPLNADPRTFTSDFGIEVRNDSVFSYMPYFGKNYVQDFTTTKNSPMGFIQAIDDYDYNKTRKKYIITIKVKNIHELVTLVFHISKMGNTSVSASFFNRQSIRYDGEILIPQAVEMEEEQE